MGGKLPQMALSNKGMFRLTDDNSWEHSFCSWGCPVAQFKLPTLFPFLYFWALPAEERCLYRQVYILMFTRWLLQLQNHTLTVLSKYTTEHWLPPQLKQQSL